MSDLKTIRQKLDSLKPPMGSPIFDVLIVYQKVAAKAESDPVDAENYLLDHGRRLLLDLEPRYKFLGKADPHQLDLAELGAGLLRELRQIDGELVDYLNSAFEEKALLGHSRPLKHLDAPTGPDPTELRALREAREARAAVKEKHLSRREIRVRDQKLVDQARALAKG